MALTRPLKEGSVTTYQQKVALGFKDILASEADGDHDTMYAAWNAGVDTVNVKDGAITTPKLNDLSVTVAKIAKGNAFYVANSVGDVSNVTITASDTFLKEISIAVDPNRIAFLMARLQVQILRATVGAQGASFLVRTYIGGTSGTTTGTLLSQDTGGTHALTVQNSFVTLWYPYFTTYTPTASPLLWKIFASNGDATNYTLTKTAVTLLVAQLA